jgi:hypothetical protein
MEMEDPGNLSPGSRNFEVFVLFRNQNKRSGSLHLSFAFSPTFFHHFGNPAPRVGRHTTPAPRTAGACSSSTPTPEWPMTLKC